MKLDSFPFHGENFLRATAGWPKSKVGCYVALLWHQWVEHAIPGDDVSQIARILGETRIQTIKIWDGELAGKFPKWEDGKFRNRRLEVIRERVLEEIRQRSDHGRKGAEVRWGKNRKKAPPATMWKRSVGLAHQIMDDMPKAGITEWREEFKDRAQKQGIPYSQREGKSNTPLVSRAIAYCITVRTNRKGTGPWRKKGG